MDNRDVFDFLSANLSIEVQDASEPSSCGGEVEGSLGVTVKLLLCNPSTGEKELISEGRALIG